MSKFSTKIPVSVQELVDALPKGSFVHSIAFHRTTNEVDIVWEHDRFESGLTVPLDISPDDVLKKKLPKAVKIATDKASPPVKKTAPEAIVEAAKPTPAPDPLIRSKEEFETAVASGQALEFQGIRSCWEPLEKGTAFVQGFYYRPAKKESVLAEA